MTLRLGGGVRNFANRIVRRMGFGGVSANRVRGQGVTSPGLITRAKEAFKGSAAGRLWNSAPAKIDAWGNAAMSRFGNTGVAKWLDRKSAGMAAWADKWDIDKRLGNLGERAGRNVGYAGTGSRFELAKGAPEQIAALCGLGTGSDVLSANARFAEDGLRVLAVAARAQTGAWRLLGLVGLHDPVRAGAAEAVRIATRANIRTVMLTGDQRVTAAAIAREVGLTGRVIEGRELPALLAGPDAAERLAEVSVVARMAPKGRCAAINRSGLPRSPVSTLEHGGPDSAVTRASLRRPPAAGRSRPVPATLTHTRPPPTARPLGMPGTLTVAVVRWLSGSIRLTVPRSLLAAHTAPAPTATVSTPGPTSTVIAVFVRGSTRHSTPADGSVAHTAPSPTASVSIHCAARGTVASLRPVWGSSRTRSGGL